MTWTTPADLRAQVERLWDRGELLRACVTETIPWPLRLKLKTPSANDLSERFDAVRLWARALTEMAQVRIESREWTHRVQGRQRLPSEMWIDSLQNALSLIGQTRAAGRFRALWQQTSAAQPALLPWMSRRPLLAVELEERWDQLLAIVSWLQSHPRPGVYVRQVDVAGVDSKFIEAHRGVLTEWLDLTLAPEAIDASAIGTPLFARRYGFLDKPLRIRFRLLDEALLRLPGCEGLLDIALDAQRFATLAIPVTSVFITENETNFLAFPPVERALVIFGAGYGWESLSRAHWLRRCDLRYWGDIDTHGFAILDQLRAQFPQATSFLMDRETLLAHRAHWGTEPEPVRHDLTRLTAEEAALYDTLRFDHLQPRLRLEQERVKYGWMNDRVADDVRRR